MHRKTMRSFLICLGILFLAGCSDAPRQYSSDNAISLERDRTKIPTDQLIKIPEIPVGQSNDEIARENSLKPILYGVGVAGITFDNTLTESKDLLSKPFFGPRPSDGLTAYYSGIYVWWRADSPRKPEIMLINSAYQGSLDIGGEFGKIRINHDFSAYFSEEDPKGEGLLVNLYNALEEIDDPQFSCVTEKICRVITSDNDFIFDWPKMGLLLSKDRKVLYRMMLLNGVAQGKLDNDLDIVTGEFALPGVEETIGLGEKWGDLLQSIKINPDTSVSRSMFTKNYSGILLALSKSQFDRSYTEPSAEETLKAIAVYSGFKKLLKIKGQFVKINQAGGQLSLELVSSLEGQPAESQFLNLKLGLKKQDQIPFLKALVALLESSLKGGSVDEMVFSSLSGFHEDTNQKGFGASVVQFDKATGSGKLISFEVRESTGDIGYIEVNQIDEPIDQIIIPSLTKPIVAGEKQLAGFALGQALTLSAIDVGREEATVTIPSETKGGVKVRALYNPDGILKAVYEEGKLERERLKSVRVGSLRVSLGVVDVEEGASADESVVKIVSISTSNNVAGTQDLCGLTGFVVKAGEKDTEIKEALDKAISAAKKVDSTFSCSYLFEEDPNATGVITAIYFPKDRIKLSFSDRELASTTIYARMREVQK